MAEKQLTFIDPKMSTMGWRMAYSERRPERKNL